MNVKQLIAKLEELDDKGVETVFFCDHCSRYIEIFDMKAFGFHQPLRRTGPSPLMKRLAEIMPKKPEQVQNPEWGMRIRHEPIRQAADTVTAWLKGDLPQDERDVAALLWTFGEFLNGHLERQLNVIRNEIVDIKKYMANPLLVVNKSAEAGR